MGNYLKTKTFYLVNHNSRALS